MKTFNQFTGMNPRSITLRFELKPIGRTREHIEKSGVLDNDKKRADDYQKVKPIIDKYHQWFIDQSLKNLTLDWNPLKEAIDLFRKENSDEHRKSLSNIQKGFRKEIFENFKKQESYDLLFKKELLTDVLPSWLENADKQIENVEALDTFKKFSVYFKGFQDNRENVYSEDEISTSVPYRIVHVNFPKFVDNIRAIEKIRLYCPSVIEDTEKELLSLLNGRKLSDFFTIDSYNSVITQKGIEFYNTLLGGYTTEDGTHYKGLKEKINQFYQQPNTNQQQGKECRLTVLYKQILSDRESSSFNPKQIETEEQLLEGIREYKALMKTCSQSEPTEDIFEALQSLLKESFSDQDAMKDIYINSASLPSLSQIVCDGSWSDLNYYLETYGDQTFKSLKEKKSWSKKDAYSLRDIITALPFNSKEKDISQLLLDKVSDLHDKIQELSAEIDTLVAQPLERKNELRESQEKIMQLKNWLDAILDYTHFFKMFDVKDESEKYTSFYVNFDELTKQLELVIPIYNKARSFLTQKVSEDVQIKLNFDNPTLADGWDQSKEKDNSTLLFERDGLYYLGILNTKKKPDLQDLYNSEGDKVSEFHKINYFQMASPTKDIPNLMLIDGNAVRKTGRKEKDGTNRLLEEAKEENLPENVNRIRKEKSYLKSSPNYNKADTTIYISYYMECIKDYKKNLFDFNFKQPDEYEDYNDFIDDVSDQSYKITFSEVSSELIDSWIDEGKLFFFQIYSKDFAEKAKGTPNLHTLYWKALFSPENLKDVVLKLNGEAELFYRPESVTNPYTHKKGDYVVGRRTNDEKTIPESIHKELQSYINKLSSKESLSEKASSYLETMKSKQLEFDIVKDKRFSKEKFLFHVPITLNFKAKKTSNKEFNIKVQECLMLKENPYIIGLDRGENNLIYLTMIDRKGNIVLREDAQMSFNVISDGLGKVDYKEKLVQREKERDLARKSWDSIGKIKDLKEGYLSGVIHKIAELMVEYDAMLVLEDLNFGFKRGRFKIERQVYQKFEKMLIDKLNYLTFKKRPIDEEGGLLKGYQLTNEFDGFQKLGKQSGFLFYVPAAYTSKIDPTTGFVNIFDTKSLTTIKSIQDFFSKFDSIRYSKEGFVFSFDYKKFKTFQTDFQNKWEVLTSGWRYKKEKKGDFGWQSRKIELTPAFEGWFIAQGINYKSGKDLRSYIQEIKELTVLDALLNLFKLTLQLRNSKDDEDLIISPIKNNKGVCYISDPSNRSLPIDADANGAYHIALKGLYLLEKEFNTKIDNKEWFKFVQSRSKE